jgi:hypothetical protein
MALTPASRAAGGQVGLSTALAAVGLLYLLSSRGDEPGGVGRDPVRVITPNQQVNIIANHIFFHLQMFQPLTSTLADPHRLSLSASAAMMRAQCMCFEAQCS